MNDLKRVLLAVVVAVSFAVLIRVFVIEAYRIPSTSMKPTLEPGDTVFVYKWGFGSTKASQVPNLGTVIVYNSPKEPAKDYIKRLIAKGGDRVDLKRGEIYINGNSIKLSGKSGLCHEEVIGQIKFDGCWDPPILKDFGPIIIEKDHYFVIGDSRSESVIPWEIILPQAIRGIAWRVWISVEPTDPMGAPESWFSRFRFERMLKRVE